MVGDIVMDICFAYVICYNFDMETNHILIQSNSLDIIDLDPEFMEALDELFDENREPTKERFK